MSRRSEKRWEEFVRPHRSWDGESAPFDYVGIARDAGIDWRDYLSPLGDGRNDVDAEALLEAAQAAMGLDDSLHQTRIIAYITVYCQKCDWRLDRIDLQRPTAGAPRMPVEQSQIGAFIPSDGPIAYDCPTCGRIGIQVSTRRMREVFREAIELDAKAEAAGDVDLTGLAWSVRTRSQIRA